MSTKVARGSAMFAEYKGPTDHRGSRVLVKLAGSAERFTFAWDYSLDADANMDSAAQQTAARMSWDVLGSQLVRSSVANGGYVYMLVWPGEVTS